MKDKLAYRCHGYFITLLNLLICTTYAQQQQLVNHSSVSCDFDDGLCGWEATPIEGSWTRLLANASRPDWSMLVLVGVLQGPRRSYALTSSPFRLSSPLCLRFHFGLDSGDGWLSLRLLQEGSKTRRVVWERAGGEFGDYDTRAALSLLAPEGDYRLQFEAATGSAALARFSLDNIHLGNSSSCNVSCFEGEFRCREDTCRPLRAWCDGARDCPGGEDEAECGAGSCPVGWSRCGASGHCVAAARLCDAVLDCPDGEDERFCLCRPGEFQCRDGLCLPLELRCNGRQDCPDNSDEESNCECGVDEAHGFFCDGVPDCVNATDERGCAECGPAEFACDGGRCLPQNFLCNGVAECGDAFDERDCLRLEPTMPFADHEEGRRHSKGYLVSRVFGLDHVICVRDSLPPPAFFAKMCVRLGFGALAAVEMRRIGGPVDLAAVSARAPDSFEHVRTCLSGNAYYLACTGVACSEEALSELPRPVLPLLRRLRIFGSHSNCRVEGSDAGDPWHVAIVRTFSPKLLHPDIFLCSGTILDERWVLTAAHCLAHQSNETTLEVRAGFIRRSSAPSARTQVRRVLAVHRHPEFGLSGMRGDVGLVELESELAWSRFVRPACVDSSEESLGGAECRLVGWGRTARGSARQSQGLRALRVRLISDAECRRADLILNRNLHPGLVCGVGLGVGSGPCQGDSGGGLFCGGRLVGLTSFSPLPCAAHPTAFTRVAHYKDWIAHRAELADHGTSRTTLHF